MSKESQRIGDALYKVRKEKRISQDMLCLGLCTKGAFSKFEWGERRPDRLYLSLGNKEDKTRNPYMKTVRQNTESLFRFFREQGIPAEFRLHPGGHYQRPAERTAAGIVWLMNQ